MISVVCALVLAHQAVPNVHALLIGIPYRNPLTLNTKADVAAIKGALMHFGVGEAQIKVIETPAECTKAGILKSLDEFAAQTKAGDQIYIHISGHGSQFKDTDEGALEPDGYDESIVSADVKPDDFDNINAHILDDEWHRAFVRIAQHHPATLTVSFDACHSSSASRGEQAREVPQSFWATTQRDIPQTDPGSGNADTSEFPPDVKTAFLSATRSDRKAYEAKFEIKGKASYMGAFSSGIAYALEEAQPGTSVRQIFERASGWVHSLIVTQDPQAEGTLDQAFLSGDPRPSAAYLLPSVNKDGDLLVPAGVFTGITPGTQFEIRNDSAIDRSDANTLVALVQVPEDGVTEFASALKVTSYSENKLFEKAASDEDKWAILKRNISRTRAFEVRRPAPDNSLKIAVDARIIRDTSWKACSERISKMALTSTLASVIGKSNGDLPDGDYDLLVEPVSGKPGEWQINRGRTAFAAMIGGNAASRIKPFTVSAADPKAPDLLQSLIEREANTRFLLKMANTQTQSKVKFEFRMRRVKTVEAGRFQRYDSVLQWPWETGFAPMPSILPVPVDTYIALEVRNVGTKPAYLNILDLTDDGTVGRLFPESGDVQGNQPFSPNGDWVTLMNPEPDGVRRPIIFKITLPLGFETYKLIATEKKIDVTPLISKDKAREVPTAGETEVEKLLRLSTTGQRTVDTVTESEKSNWWTEQIVFEVIR